MVRFPKLEYSVLAEQKLPWLKKMIDSCHVLMMTMMMMILKMNMMIKSSCWSLKKLISKHMKLQKRHGDLICSHKKLMDSYALLEATHEVMVTTVKDS
jgi:hypothetical protein